MAPIPPAPVKPGVEQHGPPPDGFVPPRRRPEQALYCSVCGTDNELDRKLCRSCGAVLPRAATDRQPWWRRIVRGSTPATAGDRPGQRRRTRARRGRRAIRAAIGLALLGAVAVLAFPARGAVVSAYHKVADRFSTGYERVTAVSAQASTSAKGHEANKAIDGVKSTAWAEGVPGRGTNQWLTIRLGGKADLAQIGIIPGASDNEQAFRATSRPREILLRFSNRTEQTIKLRDEPTFQTFGVSATGVDSVRLDVLSAFPGQTRLDQTSIAEVEFYVKK